MEETATPQSSTSQPLQNEIARLFLIEDHLVMRAALKLLLDSRADLQVVGEAANRGEALHGLQSSLQAPDIILLDLELSDGTSADFIPMLRQAAPSSRVLVLTGTPDMTLHRRALGLGAMGLVRKEQPPETLLRAIERVRNGEVWIDPVLMQNTFATPQHLASESDIQSDIKMRIASLSPREREIVALIGQGLKNKPIAARLFLSERTVHSHLSSIFRKLSVADRTELALFAAHHGLL